ncbi:MAG: hypothetical protein R3F39_20450 [Myxococcota bacterium]
MPVQHEDFITMYKFPSGRAAYAMRQAVAAAKALGDADAVQRADVVLALATATRDMELRYRKARFQPLYGPQADTMDAQVDRTMSAMMAAVGARLAIAGGPDDADPAIKAAARIERELLPRGVSYVTSLSYVEEHESVALLVKRLAPGGDLAAEAKTLGLEPYVKHLHSLNTAFGAELAQATPPSAPSWDAIRAERAKMHRELVRYAAVVLGRYAGDDEDSQRGREALLGPVLAQQRALAASFRNRRGMPDVDPQSGEIEAGMDPLPEDPSA